MDPQSSTSSVWPLEGEVDQRLVWDGDDKSTLPIWVRFPLFIYSNTNIYVLIPLD